MSYCSPNIMYYVLKLSMQNLYKQLLRASRQWRDLKNRMHSGLGYEQEDDSTPDGSMAIFCPACPQPGINLPDDWKERYTPYAFIIHISYLVLIVPKDSTNPNLYHGWQLLCRALKMSNWGPGCPAFRRNGLHGQSRFV